MIMRVAAFASALVLGGGLAISGMTRPSKVIGFLDVFGRWDASLAFVMASAIMVCLVAYRLIMRRASPIFDVRFHLLPKKALDLRLMLGAAIFGVGYGRGVSCPDGGSSRLRAERSRRS